MDAIVGEGVLVLAERINQLGSEARGADGLDIGLDKFAEHGGQLEGYPAQGIRFGDLEVEEDGCEDDRHHHVHLVLTEDAVWVLVRLEREIEHVGGEVDVGEIANAVAS